MSALVVEFGDSHCRNVFFPPLDRRMRGRFDPTLAVKHDRDAGELVSQYPDGIAGQQLEINTQSGEVAVLEPLHAFPAIEQRLKQRGLRLAPARQVANCDLETALWYASEAVKAGQAKVVSGKFPELIDENKVRKDLFIKPPVNQAATLQKAIENQTAAFTRLADVLERALTAKR
jgi:hypothetical protein